VRTEPGLIDTTRMRSGAKSSAIARAQGMDRALGGDIGGNADLAGMPLNAGQVDDDATVTFPHSGMPYSAVRWIEPTLTAMQRMKVSNDVVSASP
jgi:hypothetical protein